MSYLLDYNPGTQQWGYPRRGASLSGTIIVHTAECAADNVGEDTSAEGCASMIANRADYGSYHRLVDSDSIIEMLPWEYEAWQDSETNPWAVGISAALRTSDWLSMPADRADRVYRHLAICAADFVSYMAGKGITVPLVRISGAQARARVPGFCAHGDSGIARSDPGADFDWDKFFRYTAEALGGGITYQGTTITPAGGFLMALNDEAQENIYKAIGRLDKAVAEIYARVFGRDVQRWYNPDNPGDVRTYAFEGSVAARSTDVNDVLSTNRIIEANTNKVLTALSGLPGIDASVIADLREQLAAELKEATASLSVTLEVKDDK